MQINLNHFPPYDALFFMNSCGCNIIRVSSRKYIDSDGDVAHEFYEQQRITYKSKDGRRKRSRVVMRRIPNEELTPLVCGYIKVPSHGPVVLHRDLCDTFTNVRSTTLVTPLHTL